MCLSKSSYVWEIKYKPFKVINNWVGCVYQTTNENIAKPFMSGIDPTDPLNIKQ